MDMDNEGGLLGPVTGRCLVAQRSSIISHHLVRVVSTLSTVPPLARLFQVPLFAFIESHLMYIAVITWLRY